MVQWSSNDLISMVSNFEQDSSDPSHDLYVWKSERATMNVVRDEKLLSDTHDCQKNHRQV